MAPHRSAAVTQPAMATTNTAATMPSRRGTERSRVEPDGSPGSYADGAVISTAATVVAIPVKVDRRSQDSTRATATLRVRVRRRHRAPTRARAEIRRICLALPEATERLSHGSPTFFVRGKKTFVMFLDDHHGDGRLAIWCAAPPGVQAQLVEQEPERFFRPPYVGGRGWLGVRLDVDPDWDEMTEICADAYRQVAPKTLIAELDARRGGAS